MVMDMPATRTIGIPALKLAAKAILGLEDEVCGTAIPLVEAVVEEDKVGETVVPLVEAVVEVCETVVPLVEAVIKEVEATD
jgi:hypothetical protein